MPLPLAIPLAMGAVGVAGGIANQLFNKSKKVQPVQIDRANYQYGGSPDYFVNRQRDMQQAASMSGTRQAYDYNASQQNDAIASANMARDQQARLAGQLSEVVAGRGGPSVAEQQMRAGNAQAAKNALQVAASARGGNYASAAGAAQQQNAMAAQATNQQTGMLRAQEIAQARGELGSLYGQMRAGDVSTGQLAISGQQAQADAAMRQMQINDAKWQAAVGNELAMNNAQMQGGIALGNAQLQAGMAAQGMNAQQSAANKQQWANIFGGLAQGGGGMLGMMAGSGGGAAPQSLATAQASPGYQAMVNQQYQNYMQQYGGGPAPSPAAAPSPAYQTAAPYDYEQAVGGYYQGQQPGPYGGPVGNGGGYYGPY